VGVLYANPLSDTSLFYGYDTANKVNAMLLAVHQDGGLHVK
jgi:hypothetical protein